jgi:2-polyprenyl-3-methyl-5-hydroxy-6-metoxy-1,4-benzoquinol methylase
MDPRGLNTMAPEIRNLVNYYRWIFDTIRPFLGNKILEIGPGYGNLAWCIRKEGRAYIGIDTDETVIASLRERFSGENTMAFIRADLNDPSTSSMLADYHPDTVVSMNVLEHIADPAGHLRHIFQLLRNGQKLLLIVPGMQALYGTLDAQAGHYRRFSKGEAARCLTEAGFRVKRIFYFNSIGAVGWFITGRILKKSIDSQATGNLALFYDRVVIPFIRPIDSIFHSFFGQSIICIAEK